MLARQTIRVVAAIFVPNMADWPQGHRHTKGRNECAAQNVCAIAERIGLQVLMTVGGSPSATNPAAPFSASFELLRARSLSSRPVGTGPGAPPGQSVSSPELRRRVTATGMMALVVEWREVIAAHQGGAWSGIWLGSVDWDSQLHALLRVQRRKSEHASWIGLEIPVPLRRRLSVV